MSGSLSLHFIWSRISDTRDGFAPRWGITIFEFASARWGPVSVSGRGAVGSLAAARLEIRSRCSSSSSGPARVSGGSSSASAPKRSPSVSAGPGLNSFGSLESETCSSSS